MTHPYRFTCNPLRAFTLVETVLAIGVTAFALSALMGLMPVAFSQLGAARNCVVVAELGNSFLSDASQMKFSELEELQGEKSWSDSTGIRTDDVSKAVYEVYCPKVSDFAPNSKVVILEIYRAPRTADDSPLERFVSVISDSGR